MTTPSHFMEITPPPKRRKGSKAKRLTTILSIEIAYRALIKKELQQELAKEFRASNTTVCRIVNQANSRPESFSKAIQNLFAKQAVRN